MSDINGEDTANEHIDTEGTADEGDLRISEA